MDLFYTEIKTKLGILHASATNNFLTSLSWKKKKKIQTYNKKN